MNKFINIILISCFAVFLLAGNSLATPFNTRPVAVGAAWPGEDPLQTILDNVTGGTINASLNQSSSALWMPSDIDSNIYTIAMFTSIAGTFGIYSPSLNTQVDLLSISPVGEINGDVNQTDPTVDFIISGGILSFGGSSYAGFDSFGFYWQPDNVTRFTEDSRNGNTAYALAYEVPAGTVVDLEAYIDYSFLNAPVEVIGDDDWILAFEDYTDFDFQDAVFFIEDMKPIPEPATMLLVGSGLIGLAGLGRRKFFKK